MSAAASPLGDLALPLADGARATALGDTSTTAPLDAASPTDPHGDHSCVHFESPRRYEHAGSRTPGTDRTRRVPRPLYRESTTGAVAAAPLPVANSSKGPRPTWPRARAETRPSGCSTCSRPRPRACEPGVHQHRRHDGAPARWGNRGPSRRPGPRGTRHCGIWLPEPCGVCHYNHGAPITANAAKPGQYTVGTLALDVDQAQVSR